MTKVIVHGEIVTTWGEEVGGWEEREEGWEESILLTLVLQRLSRRFNITNLFHGEILSQFKATSMDRTKG